MRILKNIRWIILALALIISAYFLFSPLVFKKAGVVVTFVDKNNKCSQIKEGDVITQMIGFSIGNKEDFEKALSTVKEKDYTTMVVNNGPGGCVALRDGHIGINVNNVPSGQLTFGIDIQGGTTTLFEPETILSPSEMEDVVNSIDKRIKLFGLPETRVSSTNNNIKISSITTEKMASLVMCGEFKAKIEQKIKVEDSTGRIKIGNNYTDFEIVDDKIKINWNTYEADQSFILQDIEFDLINTTNASIVVEATYYTNKDILNVLNDYVTYRPEFRVYQFGILVELSNDASNRFSKITKGLKTIFIGNRPVLEGSLVYYLDGKVISRLDNIQSEMTGEEIFGIKESRDAAVNDKLKIQAALQFGTLPTLKLVGTEYFEPVLRDIIISLSSLITLIIVSSTIAITHFRYKIVKLGGWILLFVGIDIFCVIGVASLTQSFLAYGWIIDIPSTIGIISLGIIIPSQMILINERIIKRNDIALSYKYKRILNMISFFNVLFFVLSFFLLFTMWRGFSFSVMIGLLIGNLITMPLYEEILKR